MITIFIDNKPHQVKADQNLLQACLSLGFDLPYFCWHPALHAVGACRQCAVKQFRDEHDTRGRIVMSCMTPVTEGLRISVDDPEARAFRAGIIEFLMTNHPHDCPVCDEGGECHLQDMTVMTGHAYRNYRFTKKTYRNQDLGPFINHEMNRCIQCYRCVRFYRDYAGGRDLDVFGSHDHVYFGRAEDGALESPFSGNLVEVCPTGVFTDKTLKRHSTRKWDLQTAPSVCVHCGLGCNTIAAERYGSLRRILNRYHHEVNGYFLCDRGRFGYEFVNSASRIRKPLVAESSHPGRLTQVAEGNVIARAVELISASHGVIGIGSPRATLEANFALRTLVGPERFCTGMAAHEQHLVTIITGVLSTLPAATIRDAEQADAVLILGEDVMNSAPRLALALRQSVRRAPMELAHKLSIPEWNDAAVRNAVQDAKGPFFIAATGSMALDDIATEAYRAAPDDIARLGFSVAREIDPSAPSVESLDSAMKALTGKIAEALKDAKRPLVVTGTGCVNEAIIHAAANIVRALLKRNANARLCCVVREGNSVGIALMGGMDIEKAAAAIRKGSADTVVILENDLFRRLAPKAARELLDRVRHLIVLDHLGNETTERADVVLPAATFAESDGTLVNNEGRAQRFFRVFVPRDFSPEDSVRESWMWLRDVMNAFERPEAKVWKNLDDVIDALTAAIPPLARLKEAAPSAASRFAGMKVPRQPHRYSGRTSMHAGRDVREHEPSTDPDSPFAFSMEGSEDIPPAALIARYWSPGWNSVQALNKFQQEVAGPLRGGDPGVRLIGPAPSSDQTEGAFFTDIPGPFTPKDGAFLVVPRSHVFGSEELSSHAPGIAARSPRPELALNPAAAAALGEGALVRLTLGDTVLRVRIALDPACPRGVASLSVGQREVPYLDLPAWGTIRTAADE